MGKPENIERRIYRAVLALAWLAVGMLLVYAVVTSTSELKVLILGWAVGVWIGGLLIGIVLFGER